MTLADTRYQQRRRALAAELAAQRVDALLVTRFEHVRYLSGFTGDSGALLVTKELRDRICTDSRFTTQVETEVPDLDVLIDRPVGPALVREIPGPRRVGFEAAYLTVAEYSALQEAAGDGVELIPIDGAIEELRLRKDPLELDALRAVAEIGNVAIQGLLEAGELAAGRTERAVAADLEWRMRQAGSDRPSFDTIVAAGANSAMPHHGADDTVIRDGDLVTIDFGAYAGGYNSDMTRTFCVGQPSDFAREIYGVVLRAQSAGIEIARPGTPLVDVDAACREVITQAGYGEYFVHSTGHGVGIEVHEAPWASTRGEGVLREGMTLTVEPGIYVPGHGGVRIEDTLIITRGGAEEITRLPKDLTIIDVV